MIHSVYAVCMIKKKKKKKIILKFLLWNYKTNTLKNSNVISLPLWYYSNIYHWGSGTHQKTIYDSTCWNSMTLSAWPSLKSWPQRVRREISKNPLSYLCPNFMLSNSWKPLVIGLCNDGKWVGITKYFIYQCLSYHR